MFNFDYALGIEIRSEELVLAAVRKRLQGFELKHYGVIEGYRELSPPQLKNQIQEHLGKNGISQGNIIVGLPRESVIVRHIELPLEVEENLDQVVRFQIERFEPSEEERSYYDYIVLERDEEANTILLQIIMVPRSVLDQYLSQFREVGLKPSAIRVSGIAMSSLFEIHADGYPKKETCVIFSLHPDAVEMVAIAGLNRSFSEKLVALPEDYNVERLSCQLGTFLSRLDLPNQGVAKIYLTGSEAQSFLDQFLSRFSDCELLTDKLRIRSRSRPDLNVLAPSIGLAISAVNKSLPNSFNLIPLEQRIKGERPSLLPTFCLVGMLILMTLALGIRGFVQRGRLLDQVDTEIAKLAPHVERLNTLQDQLEQNQARLGELAGFMKGSQKVLRVLKEITEAIPEDTYLQNLVIQKDRVNITGYSDAASSLLPILLKSRHLKDVESRYITPVRKIGKERFNFEAVVKE